MAATLRYTVDDAQSNPGSHDERKAQGRIKRGEETWDCLCWHPCVVVNTTGSSEPVQAAQCSDKGE